MGGLGYLCGKAFLVAATVVQLGTGMALCSNPVTAPVGVLFIDGAAASAAFLASPVDPISTTAAIVTGPA